MNDDSKSDPFSQFSEDDLAGWRSTKSQLFVDTDLGSGVNLDALMSGVRLAVTTQKSKGYFIERGEGGLYISGDAQSCPTPVRLLSIGVTDEEGNFKPNFISQGMGMELSLVPQTSNHNPHPSSPTIIITDVLTDIKQSPKEE
jgi:hypothetical protein